MTSEPRTVAVVGGGILGSVLALRLQQSGARVTLLERAPSLGGLAATIDFDGHEVDRFYHVIVPSDDRMIALTEELGLQDDLSFSPVGVGFFDGDRTVPLDGLGDFAKFPLLSVAGRARLAWFVASCQLRRDWSGLEDVPLEAWLLRNCGKEVVERIWRPLLNSRFDGRWEELPATYLWARTNRMRSARSNGGAETMGCLRGGHGRLIEATARRAAELGADVRVGAGVEGLVQGEDGAVTGVRVDGVDEPYDLVIATLQPPGLKRLLPDGLQGLLSAYPQRYLGVVCLILKLRESLLPYYSVNICTPTPITTIVETSHVVGTEHTDGLRLAYVPKYCESTAPEFTEDDDALYARFTDMVGKIVPGFRQEDVVAWTVQRAPTVEPVHPRGAAQRLAPIWPDVPGLGLASAAQVYPRLLNGDSVVRLAEDVSRQATERLAAIAPDPTAAVLSGGAR